MTSMFLGDKFLLSRFAHATRVIREWRQQFGHPRAKEMILANMRIDKGYSLEMIEALHTAFGG